MINFIKRFLGRDGKPTDLLQAAFTEDAMRREAAAARIAQLHRKIAERARYPSLAPLTATWPGWVEIATLAKIYNLPTDPQDQ